MNARAVVLGSLVLLSGVAAADDPVSIWSISIPTPWTEVPTPPPPNASIEFRGYKGNEGTLELAITKLPGSIDSFEAAERGIRDSFKASGTETAYRRTAGAKVVVIEEAYRIPAGPTIHSRRVAGIDLQGQLLIVHATCTPSSDTCTTVLQSLALDESKLAPFADPDLWAGSKPEPKPVGKQRRESISAEQVGKLAFYFIAAVIAVVVLLLEGKKRRTPRP